MKSSKIIKQSFKDDSIATMFNQMTGVGEMNITICYKKYDNIRMYLGKIYDLLKIFCSSALFVAFNELRVDMLDIKAFMEKIQGEQMSTLDMHLDVSEMALFNNAKTKVFQEKFEQLKKSNVLNALIGTCDKLVRYKKYLIGEYEDGKMSDKFILNMAGTDWTPLSDFSTINIKYIIDKLEFENGASEINFMLLFLNKLLSLTYKLYKEYTKPDFDLDELSESLIQSIESLKKHIPRCDKAFNKIRNSIGLLKENFGGYYRDFIQTQNKTIIIENFICDLANDTDKIDPELTRQFNTIVKFYKKHAVDKKIDNNPEIKKLFEAVNNTLCRVDEFQNVVKVKNLNEEEEATAAADDKTAAADKTVAADKTAAADKIALEEYKKKSVDELMREFDLK